ncbi:MAG: TIR domain-containing protein, partial [Candidatus Didemnitutus sp.]|nr:TIR domain-containing protein [Candidatus Didemnitutus sp.]
YASQDAEAAKRIANALRAAGVEVWFDQSELVGGDAWDQKIRGQVKACALFVPIISAATQARLEGYFRLEWKIAAQRTHTMADAKPFLLPVVIDATRDADAHVPEEFRAVQWTRLPGGETPERFCARVKAVLGGAAAAVGRGLPTPPSGVRTGNAAGKGDPALQRKRPTSRLWFVPAIAGLAAIVALAIWQPWKKSEPAPATGVSIEGAKPAAPLSEARKLTAQARALLVKPGGAASKFDTAALLCERALALDPIEAEAWAVASQIDTRMWFHSFDRTERRSENARSKAAKALNLAPESFEARLAQSTFLVLVSGRPLADQAEPVLRALSQENPREFRVLDILGQLLAAQGKFEESVACNDEAARLPGGAATALMQKAWTFTSVRRIAEADAALDQSIAVQPISGNITLRVFLDLGWHGDPDRALAALRKLPADEMAEDNGISAVVRLYRWRREPAELLNFLNTVPRDWLTWGITGPKAAVTGDANAELGKLAAAREDWRQALTLVEQRLAGTPNDRDLLEWKAYLLASLGEKAKARETYQRSLEAPAHRRALLNIEKLDRLLSPEELLDELEQRIEGVIEGMKRGERPATRFVSAADLRLNPAWDGVRSRPQFQALQARLDADPRFTPTPKKPGPAIAAVDDKSAPADKSVTVLAFANLSDDKANEYFSDGISEELLNVLAQVPGLKVTARTSAFHFKGKDTPIPEVARQLGVAYVIEGSVRKQGDKVRITAQLIKASDGFHVWSETFTRDLKDIFAVQDEIAGLIARNLELKIAGVAQVAAIDPEAYRLFLEARHLAQRENIEGWNQSIILYRRAIERDSGYAAAWAELAQVYQRLARFGGLPALEGMREARTAAQRALELDPKQVVGLDALGWVQRTADWDWMEAKKSFQQALQLAPENPVVMVDAAVLYVNIGRVDEGIALARRAVERDPLSATVQFYLGVLLEVSGRFEESLQPITRAIELAPAADEFRTHLARALACVGRLSEAEAIAKQEPNEGYRVAIQSFICFRRGDLVGGTKLRNELIANYSATLTGYIAISYADTGDRDEAFVWLNRAYDIRDAAIAWSKTGVVLQNLHTDPRWPVFLRKIGLADDQLK